MNEGKKYDTGKPDWHALPLCMVKHLVPVAEAGVAKYGRFNILKKFENPEERFFSAMMRHAEEAQIDPLSIDQEDGCYHLAKVAFNALAELNQALMKTDGNAESGPSTIADPLQNPDIDEVVNNVTNPLPNSFK